MGDNAAWGKVVTKAREGAPDALDAVGHHGEPTTHPVCKEVLSAISPGGTKGAELQKRFAAPPFGWPKDAVSGAIFTLLAAGNIRAAQDGKDLAGPKELLPTQIGKVTLYKEDDPPSVGQRLAVKGLLATAGIAYEAGQEGAALSALLQRLKDLASRAGGPPPLPESPDTDHVDALMALGGNQRFRAVADDHDRLSSDLESWRAADQQREKREREWHDLQRLLRHADGLPIAEKVAPASAAIRDGRQLLDDPDPLAPLLAELAAALRDEATRRAVELATAQHEAVAELEVWEDWHKLDTADRDAIVADAKLIAAEPPDVSSEAKLLEALDATPLTRVDRPPQPRGQPPGPSPPASRQATRTCERRRHRAIGHHQERRRSQRLRRGAARSRAAPPRCQEDRNHLRLDVRALPLHCASSSRRRCWLRGVPPRARLAPRSTGWACLSIDGLSTLTQTSPYCATAFARSGASSGGDRELLVAECAYEQWHRLLFARFLAENSLLLHPRVQGAGDARRLRGARRRARRA